MKVQICERESKRRFKGFKINVDISWEADLFVVNMHAKYYYFGSPVSCRCHSYGAGGFFEDWDRLNVIKLRFFVFGCIATSGGIIQDKLIEHTCWAHDKQVRCIAVQSSYELLSSSWDISGRGYLLSSSSYEF
ncbi:hypothetical protein C5167_024731 [Papaver somniferum]|uniref:Uncharacterized protein n=1 Tax=Papaver somniferum TaxID=3469 RepID=A0A4Y7JPE7_PAPSO|nr:hypothetical protein C5167_024731 [Papaver somniferum]